MRARKKKNTVPRLARAAGWFVSAVPAAPRLRLEIGCGKGAFLSAMAKDFPDCFFVGVEKIPDVAVMAAEKAQREGIENLRFLLGDAQDLLGREEQIFVGKQDGTPHFETKIHPPLCGEGVAERIYLNFSDPWSRNRDAHRRLTYREFLCGYARILTPDGWVECKTDNRPLFDFSLAEFSAEGWEILDVETDLHHSSRPNPYQTEYERRFSSQGVPICFLRARPKKNEWNSKI